MIKMCIRYICFILSLLILLSCSSRLRLELFVTTDEVKRKVKVNQTDLFLSSRLNNPKADKKIIPGKSNTAVLTLGGRWEKNDENSKQLLSFDEYWKARLYLQLPEQLESQKLNLKDNSFFILLGQYQIPKDEKIFLPQSGSLTIDSLASNRLFISIDGIFKNPSQITYNLNGKFKLKVK